MQTGNSLQPDPEGITRLLQQAGSGDRASLDRLFGLVYGELRRIAERHLRNERPGHTLLPTALVHETYLRLVKGPPIDWRGRAQFYGIASRAMRQILVEHARRRNADKRGGEQRRTTLGEEHAIVDYKPDEVLALDSALDRLDSVDERLRKVVEYRYFGGLNDHEIAEMLDVSTRSVQRDWAVARAWLYRHLHGDHSASGVA